MTTEIVIDVKQETVEFFGEQGMGIYDRIMNVVAYPIMREMRLVNGQGFPDLQCETIYLEVESYLTGLLGDQVDEIVSVAMMMSYEVDDPSVPKGVRATITTDVFMYSTEMKSLNEQVAWLKDGMTEEARNEWYRLVEDEWRERSEQDLEDAWERYEP